MKPSTSANPPYGALCEGHARQRRMRNRLGHATAAAMAGVPLDLTAARARQRISSPSQMDA